MKRRFVSIRLPHWSADRARRRSGASAPREADSERPVVFTLSGAGGVRLHALSREAVAAGLTPGMTVSDARAFAPDLSARPADPDGDREALTALARWCGRWTPWTAARSAAPGEDAVLAEITGCARVHGGEAALLTDIAARMAGLGLDACVAAAPTIGLAWGLAWADRPGGAPISVESDGAPAALAALPVRALRIDAETAEALESLGLRRAGALLPLRRADLARRFGTALVRRLDQARGAEDETLDPVLPAARLRARRRYSEPLTGQDQILRAAGEAAGDLCALLEREGLGARRAALNLYRVDGRMFEIACGAGAPVRDAAHLTRLLTERIARAEIDLGFGVELVEAAALTAEPLSVSQAELSAEPAGPDATRLSDRLGARLGEATVLRPQAQESHAPERASGWTPGGDGAVRADPRRAVLMLESPEPVEAVAQMPDGPPRLFVWRRVRHRVARAEGPERIAPEWWRDGAGTRLTRDYFRVETEEGRRFVLCRDGLHGRDSHEVRWFMCGAG